MSEPLTLQGVMYYIGTRYPFDKSKYPRIPEDKRGQFMFAVNHTLLHIDKAIAKISTEQEKFDHNGEYDTKPINEAIVKLFINTLKLAQEAGMGADDLKAAVYDTI